MLWAGLRLRDAANYLLTRPLTHALARLRCDTRQVIRDLSDEVAACQQFGFSEIILALAGRQSPNVQRPYSP